MTAVSGFSRWAVLDGDIVILGTRGRSLCLETPWRCRRCRLSPDLESCPTTSDRLTACSSHSSRTTKSATRGSRRFQSQAEWHLRMNPNTDPKRIDAAFGDKDPVVGEGPGELTSISEAGYTRREGIEAERSHTGVMRASWSQTVNLVVTTGVTPLHRTQAVRQQ